MKFCPNCGSPNDDNSKFCINCGAPLSDPQPAVPPVPPAQSTPQVPPQGAYQIPPQGNYQIPPQNMMPNAPMPGKSPKKNHTGLIIGIIAALIILAVLAFAAVKVVLPAVRGDNETQAEETEVPTTEEETEPIYAVAATEDSEKETEPETEAALPVETRPFIIGSNDGEISVLYYTFGDTYLSSVRAALDALLDASGLEYNDYDSNNSQVTQTEQVQTALAKGSSCLIVNLVNSGSDDAAQNIIDLASAQNVPVIFFNRSVSQEVVEGYSGCAFIGTDYREAGVMQGQMTGRYLLDNWNACDLNGDGVVSYVMFKGQENNEEAIALTEYSVENANAIIEAAGRPALEFYDPSNSNKYLVDQTGAWSAAAALDYMNTILSQYNEANGNMVELVIANNDEMAMGAILALQAAGYNQEDGSGTTIPVFGIDATDAAKARIDAGVMTGTIGQDAESMAEAIAIVAENFLSGNNKFDFVSDIVPAQYIEGGWRVNIPYQIYMGN